MADKEMTFKYKFSQEYNPEYVNGAFGGITPKKELVVNFFMERYGLPIAQKFELSEEGLLGDVIEAEPPDLHQSMVRFVKVGVVLNLDSAKKIHEWLGGHIERLEESLKDEK